MMTHNWLVLTMSARSNPQDPALPVRRVNGPISHALAVQTVDRAIRGMEPGGVLELCFEAGEAFLDPEWIDRTIDDARARAKAAGVRLRLSVAD